MIVCCCMMGCKPDKAEVSVTRDNRFTGRGNPCETLLTIDIIPQGECTFKGVTCELQASASDVDALCICAGDEVIGRIEVTEGKSDYEIACHRVFADSMRFRLAADINMAATEGGRVSADITSVRFRGCNVVPDTPEPGAREILLCRKCLYRPGDYGSLYWRIPAIRQLSDGTLLTVNDRRNVSEDDLPGEIDVVSRYSMNGGRTWSEPVFVARNTGPNNGYGDPSLVELDDGTVICTFCGGQNLSTSCWENPQRSYFAVSKDHGQTWSTPQDITDRVWGPHPANAFCKRYHSSFFSSGNSLILKQGPHKGRVLVANVTTYDGWKGMCNHAVYTDDGGQTWNVSNLAYADKGDEAKMVELQDGSILMSIRQKGKRAYTISTDGGVNWSKAAFWDDMCVTACNGDLIRYNNQILMHTIPDAMQRENVSLLMSFDEGKTWSERKTICAGPSQYSSITVLPDGSIGAYIEENRHGVELWYENFSLQWLRTH